MFESNIKLFGGKLSPYLSELTKMKDSDSGTYEVVTSKSDVPTLKVSINSRELFVHSKYNPIQEAERLINNLDETVLEKEHIIFFGVGLGYHIEQFARKYPEKSFSIIEPNAEILLRLLECKQLVQSELQNVKTIYIYSEKIPLHQYLTTLSGQLKADASVYVLPSYERIFKDEVMYFYKVYKEALKMTRSNVITTQAFGKRWVINSLMNLSTTLTTQNILEKKEYFKGKPIIIAAAGPSLYEDLHHLKYIKENGLAYIFAVGSANKAFIAHGITPDAVLTFDPQPHNVDVFKELISTGRTDIPMIYGTSVGFETIESYPGPLFHFVNSADTVSNFYLGKDMNDFDVQDSTTIALAALQITKLLDAGPIILAGQNLAFKNDRYYAKGIKHWSWEGEVREDKERLNVIKTFDVYGNEIEANDNLLNMRRDIENYIKSNSELVIINTTKGGADIEGAPFVPIEEVIQKYLSEKVVDKKWYVTPEKGIENQSIKYVRKMERAIYVMYELFDSCMKVLEKIDRQKSTTKIQQINNYFHKFDKNFNRILKSEFYKCFIASVLRNELQQLKKVIRNTYGEKDQVKKIADITLAYSRFLFLVQKVFHEMKIHVIEKVHSTIEFELENLQYYKHNDGVFHYGGDWNRETKSFNDLSLSEKQRKISQTISTMSSEKDAKIKFRFEGTMLQVYAQTDADFSNKVKITVDDNEKIIKTKDGKFKYRLSPKLKQKVFEIRSLKNEMHEVCIELLSDEPFHFQGIAINEGGRVYHIDEVTRLEKLEVGKRIRCNVQSIDEHGVAIVNSLGDVVTQQMPLNSYDKSYDFYIEKIYESVDGFAKYITNRNIGIVKAIYIKDNNQREFCFNRIPIMLDNQAHEIKLQCSSYYQTEYNNWEVYKLFNKKFGTTEDAWATERGTLSGWYTIEFNEPYNISCYTITSQATSPYIESEKRLPIDWIIEAFDGGNWVSIDEQKDINNWCTNEKRIFKVVNSNKYKIYRFRFLKNNADRYFLSIGEMEII